ncbi:MAG: hypothetical protein KZQ89_02820 [Candidatus Thiodiazotropha sp. (ex Lucinoma kastoroae)]|nr:hypothetical protein [Candidatus Thiodiazotropha sp. (ex Lucinoma kastoroae)]
MKEYEGDYTIGEFYLHSLTISGQLKLDRENTEIYLHSKEPINSEDIRNRHIDGLLADNKRISLIDCVTLSSGRFGGGEKDDGQNYSIVFPHYVVLGNQCIDPLEENILALNFVVGSATSMFYDFDAFGHILAGDLDSKDILRSVSEKRDRKFEIGDHPEIFYYSGKHDIFKSKTCFGVMSAFHSPTMTMPSPNGISVKNSIPIRIEFDSPVLFDEAMNRFNILESFVTLVLGQPQNIEDIKVSITSDNDYPNYLDVYSCMQEDYSHITRDRTPHPSDILINGGVEPNEFSKLLSSWLERQELWRDSRRQFINSFRMQNRYSTDRLVASANMFDILPEDAVGDACSISEEMKLAVANSKKVFKGLPHSSERDSILGALGRIGKHNLKTKVKYRAKFITEHIGDKLPEFELVINEAVNCRNYFVHGTYGKLSPEVSYSFSSFFTDTFEFIFGASDLIEAGWDIKKWSDKGSTYSHPFGMYLLDYHLNLKNLKGRIKA